MNIDDCWAKSRNTKGQLVADPVKFPGGMKAVADALHADGMHFGICKHLPPTTEDNAATATCLNAFAALQWLSATVDTDRGTQTCGGRPGSEGHEIQDSKTFADWLLLVKIIALHCALTQSGCVQSCLSYQ